MIFMPQMTFMLKTAMLKGSILIPDLGYCAQWVQREKKELMRLDRFLTVLVLEFTPLFASTMATATIGYELQPSPPGGSFHDTTCTMTSFSSGGVGCSSMYFPAFPVGLTVSGVAYSTAAFSTAGGSIEIHTDATGYGISAVAHAIASASFDETLLIPGTGAATIVGNYTYTPNFAPSNYSFTISFDQAGTILQTYSLNTPLFPSIQSSIQLGVPFELTAMMSSYSVAPAYGGDDFGGGRIDFRNFTDLEGNILSYEIVDIPEPYHFALVGILLAGLLMYKRRGKDFNQAPRPYMHITSE